MRKTAAGLLLFRRNGGQVEVLLVHPAGPLWAHKDAWSIPKGEHDPGEDHAAAAYREFEEETNVRPPAGELIDLGSSRQSSGKVNFIFALEAEVDLTDFKSNLFEMEWPPKSGRIQEFPEVDRAEWFDLVAAKTKLFKPQVVFIDRLAERLGVDAAPPQQSLL